MKPTTAAVAALALSCASAWGQPPPEWVRQPVDMAAPDAGSPLAGDAAGDAAGDRAQALCPQDRAARDAGSPLAGDAAGDTSPVEVWVGSGEIPSGWGVWVPIFTTGMPRKHLAGGVYFRTIWSPGLVPLVISTEHGASWARFTPWSCETGCQGWLRIQLNPGEYGPCEGDGPGIFCWVFAQAVAVAFDQAEGAVWYDCDLIAGTADPAIRMHGSTIIIRAVPPQYGAITASLYEAMDWDFVFAGHLARVTMRVGNGYGVPIAVTCRAIGLGARTITLDPGEWKYVAFQRFVPHSYRGRTVHDWHVSAAWAGGSWRSEGVTFKVR